jgi:hypothetical protein
LCIFYDYLIVVFEDKIRFSRDAAGQHLVAWPPALEFFLDFSSTPTPPCIYRPQQRGRIVRESLANCINRFFKKAVYTTNHSNIEKALLGRENLQQTVRILLNNGMHENDKDMSLLLQDIQKQCPTLFESILPKSEHMRSQEDSLVEDDEVPLIGSGRHLDPAAIGCIATGFAQQKLKLPVKKSDLDRNVNFAGLLRKAYASEYGKANVYEFGKKWLLWTKKLAFTDRLVLIFICFVCFCSVLLVWPCDWLQRGGVASACSSLQHGQLRFDYVAYTWVVP